MTIDIADKLPENRGDTTYTVTDTTDSSGILQNVAVDTAGKLTYTVISGKLLKLNLCNASDYTIVIDEATMDGSEADDTTEAGSNNVTTEPKEDSWIPLWIIIIGAIVIVAGLGIFFIIKKKEDKDN